MTKLEKELIQTFNITEDYYYELRAGLHGGMYLSYQDFETCGCSALYFDGDEGTALLTFNSEIQESDGFTIQLIDCTYCDIDYDSMQSIIKEFKTFDHEYDKYMDKQEALEELKLNSDRYKKALYMDDSDDEYHEEYANM